MKTNMKSLNSAIIASVAFAPLTLAQQCRNGIKPVTTGKQCPCVTVENDCVVTDPRPEWSKIRGEKCGAINVEADANGNYPDVQVNYSYSMCNYNNFGIKLKNEAKFYDWTKIKGSKQANVANPRVPLGGRTLPSGDCIEYDETFYLSTANRYNIATQLEGFVLNSNGVAKDPKFDYCYAYESKLINIKRGLCKVKSNISCKTVETGQDCQEFVSSNPGPCKDFTAKFEWRACNLEPRFMKVLSEASNVKIARKVNGKMTNDRIGRVGDLGPAGSFNSCQSFGPEFRSYSTCSDQGNVFFSANIQGTKPNGNYWYECQDFAFEKVVFNALPNTFAPTAGPTANPTSSPTFKPTAKPTSSPTARPTGGPTKYPTMNPTDNPTGGPTAKPTSKPTSKPTLSPTTKPTPGAPSKGKGGKGKRGRNASRRRRARIL